MHPVRKQRFLLITLMLIGISIAIGLILYALKQNINLFFTPTQTIAEKLPAGQRFRLGGIVQAKSVQREPNSLLIKFVITDNNKQIPVQYTGVLPDLFREGQGAVADGRLNAQGVFMADEILAKHDENYMPPGMKK